VEDEEEKEGEEQSCADSQLAKKGKREKQGTPVKMTPAAAAAAAATEVSTARRSVNAQ
jgi:hypothetical protein